MGFLKFLVTTRVYCECGQLHESIVHLGDNLQMSFVGSPYFVPTTHTSRGQLHATGDIERTEFTGVKVVAGELCCVGCGKDVLFGGK